MNNPFAKIVFLICLAFFRNSGAVSLSDLESKWITTENKKIRIADLVGDDHAIISMIYTRCAHACPMTIEKISEIRDDLKKTGHPDVKVILASFDTENDKPKQLKKYQKSRNLDPKKWIFLSASSDSEARTLAVALDVNYQKLDNGDFSHSNVITLLGPHGEILASVKSLKANSDPIVEALSPRKTEP